MTDRLAQLHRIRTEAYGSAWELPRVRPPLDVTDAEQFPNIAEARAHAKRRGLTS